VDLDVRFELLDKVGAGSYATVYRARDKELGREVAIKQIHAQFLEDPQTLERYWAEAQLLASLHHPNIVTIFDVVRDRGWLIMELMQGSLKDRLEGRQMDLRSLRTAVAHSLRALSFLHERGVVHGDIKPGNMMIDHRRRVKIGDFGLARRVSDEEGSLLKGTAKYIAPEVVSDEFGEVGPHSDLYSLGFSAYELMCGSENFEDLFPGLSAFGRDKQAAWMMWHAAADRRLPQISRVLEGVPEDVARVIQRLTEKDPAKRYRSADEALSDLKVDLKLVKTGGGGDAAFPDEPMEASAPDKKRRVIAIAAFAVSLIMSLAVLFLPEGDQQHNTAAQTQLGVVREVNADGTIEYEDPESGLPDLLTLPERPKIRLLRIGQDDQFILPKDIQPGDWIEIEEIAGEDGTKTLELTVSRLAQSTGRIAAVDAGAGRITISVTAGEVRDDLRMQVPQRARLELNGERASLADLLPDDNVQVVHLLDPAGELGHVLSELSALRLVESTGFVDGIDLENGTLEIADGRGSSRVRTLPLADDCAITWKSGEALDKAELRKGDRLTFNADVAIHSIVVTREDLQVEGNLVDLDLGAREIVVSDPQGTRQTITVPDDADLTLGSAPAVLSDLRLEIDALTVHYSEDAEGRKVAASVDAIRGVKHDRWGMLLATQAYVDPILTRLPTSTSDSRAVYDSLVRRYAMDPDWTLRMFDQGRDEVRDAIEKHLRDVGERHQLIVYIAGHAYVGADDVVYLAFKDFQLDAMPETGLPLDWLVERLEACPVTDKLLLLDVVHEGNGTDLDQQPSTPDLVYGLKTPILTLDVIGSCSENQRGHLLDQRRGAFAEFVSAGLSGPADVDRDLRVTGDELFEYLKQRFAEAQLPGGAMQTPFRLAPRGGDGD